MNHYVKIPSRHFLIYALSWIKMSQLKTSVTIYENEYSSSCWFVTSYSQALWFSVSKKDDLFPIWPLNLQPSFKYSRLNIHIYMWIFNLKKLKKYHLFALLNRISQLYNSPSWDTGGCCCQCWWVQCVPSLSSAIFHQPLHYFDVCDLWWWVAELLHNLAYNKR